MAAIMRGTLSIFKRSLSEGSTNGAGMSIVFSIFLNAFLIVVMVVFLTSLAALVVSTTEPLERAVRAASASSLPLWSSVHKLAD